MSRQETENKRPTSQVPADDLGRFELDEAMPFYRKTPFISGFLPESSNLNSFGAGLLACSTGNAFPPIGSGLIVVGWFSNLQLRE